MRPAALVALVLLGLLPVSAAADHGEAKHHETEDHGADHAATPSGIPSPRIVLTTRA